MEKQGEHHRLGQGGRAAAAADPHDLFALSGRAPLARHRAATAAIPWARHRSGMVISTVLDRFVIIYQCWRANIAYFSPSGNPPRPTTRANRNRVGGRPLQASLQSPDEIF
jgi:hypothetical protein